MDGFRIWRALILNPIFHGLDMIKICKQRSAPILKLSLSILVFLSYFYLYELMMRKPEFGWLAYAPFVISFLICPYWYRSETRTIAIFNSSTMVLGMMAIYLSDHSIYTYLNNQNASARDNLTAAVILAAHISFLGFIFTLIQHLLWGRSPGDKDIYADNADNA